MLKPALLIIAGRIAGFVAAFVHIYIFDRRFLGLSTLEKVKQKNG